MSDDHKSDILKAANKLKNAKKRQINNSDENIKATQKSSSNNDKDNGSLINGIINAVKHFKGDN